MYHSSVLTGQLADPETKAQLEHIDKMDTEQLCDFLREKHKSTAPPPETN